MYNELKINIITAQIHSFIKKKNYFTRITCERNNIITQLIFKYFNISFIFLAFFYVKLPIIYS